MKKLLPFVLFVVFAVFYSCSKEDNEKQVQTINLDVTIDAGTTFQIDVTQYGNDGNCRKNDYATLVKQATNYTISWVKYENNRYIYTFLKNGLPKSGGNGKERVELNLYESRRNSGVQNGIAVGESIPSFDDEILAKVIINITIN